MTLPKCYRCDSRPCQCKPIKATLTRLILGDLTERGRMNAGQIDDAIAEHYRRAGMKYPLLVEEALDSLVCGRRIRKTPSKWEGEYWYAIRKQAARRLEQEVGPWMKDGGTA